MTLLDVSGLKSDRALYKIWHIAAKLSHETNLAITKLSLSLIHNTIGLGLPMFINVTTRQQISIYSTGLYCYLLACTPTFGKVGVQFFCTSTLKSAEPPLNVNCTSKWPMLQEVCQIFEHYGVDHVVQNLLRTAVSICKRAEWTFYQYRCSLAKLRARSAPAQLQMYLAFYLANLWRRRPVAPAECEPRPALRRGKLTYQGRI